MIARQNKLWNELYVLIGSAVAIAIAGGVVRYYDSGSILFYTLIISFGVLSVLAYLKAVKIENSSHRL